MDQLKQGGVTLVELLLVLAILAILAVGGYGLLSLIPQSANATSATVLKQAVRQLTIQALSDEGAEMTWNGKGRLEIRSLGANPFIRSYTLSPRASLTLDGRPFRCLVLNPQGFPDHAAVPKCPGPNPGIPLNWSVVDGSYRVSFQ